MNVHDLCLHSATGRTPELLEAATCGEVQLLHVIVSLLSLPIDSLRLQVSPLYSAAF